jgi:hypothetical protein
MATEVWAKEVEGTGPTINIVNPGAGANTPGMAEEMRAMSREGRAPRPGRARRDGATAPLCRLARGRRGQRLALRRQPLGPLPPAEAARRAGRPAGFEMHPHRVDQRAVERGTFAKTSFIVVTAANFFYAGMDKGAGRKPWFNGREPAGHHPSPSAMGQSATFDCSAVTRHMQPSWPGDLSLIAGVRALSTPA